MTNSIKNKTIADERKNDPELIELQKEIDKLKNSLGYKIVDNFDGLDVENIDTFIEWARENLPDFISIEDMEDLGRRLKNNGITAGAFAIELSKLAGGMDLVGKIYTGKLNPFKYHEAFHSVFRMLLSETEIKKYLKIAKQEKLAELKKEGKTLTEALNELKNLSPIYQKMDRKQLEDTLYEEYLADRFEEFKMNNKINTGKYKSAEVASNRFTSSNFVNSEILNNNSGVVNVALKAIPISRTFSYIPGGKQVETIKYFSQLDQNAIIGTTGALYLKAVENLINDVEFTGSYNPSTLLDSVIGDYIETYNPYSLDEFYSERIEKDFNFEKELETYHTGLIDAKLEIKESVSEYLKLFDIQIENQLEELEQDDFTQDGIVKASDQWDSEANQMGGFKNKKVYCYNNNNY